MTIHAHRILLAALFCGPALWVAPAQAGERTSGFLQEADQNGDGSVTRAEATAFRDANAAKMDADKNGFVTAAEMKAYVLARMSLRADEMAAARIKAADTDGDGRLSLAEAQGDNRMDKFFARADQNGDGALSQDEMAQVRVKWAHKKGDGDCH